MKHRKHTNERKRSTNFTRNAMRVHKKNNWANPMRGGFRL